MAFYEGARVKQEKKENDREVDRERRSPLTSLHPPYLCHHPLSASAPPSLRAAWCGTSTAKPLWVNGAWLTYSPISPPNRSTDSCRSRSYKRK